MSVRPEFDPAVPLDVEELPALAFRLREYATTCATFDAGLYQVLMRGAKWLDRATPVLKRQARPWWAFWRR